MGELDRWDGAHRLLPPHGGNRRLRRLHAAQSIHNATAITCALGGHWCRTFITEPTRPHSTAQSRSALLGPVPTDARGCHSLIARHLGPAYPAKHFLHQRTLVAT